MEETETCPASVCSMFSISPMSGLLGPTDKQPCSVRITFTPKKEVLIKDEPILICRVIEPEPAEMSHHKLSPAPNMHPPAVVSETASATVKTGDTIANIPIRVSGQAKYCRYVPFLDHVSNLLLDAFM